MVSLKLSAATWLINTKTLLWISTILNISFKNITNGKSTFRSLFVQKSRYSASLRDYPEFGYMVLLQLSAATWLINTKTLHRTSTISNISFRIITIVLVTFRSLYVQKCRFSAFSTGYPKFEYMVSLQLSAATWLINTKTLLWISTILNISFKNITNGKSTFRSLFVQKSRYSASLRDYPEFGYMVLLQLSAATWLINTKTLHRTSTISNISFRIITIVLITFRSLYVQKCRFSAFSTGYPKFEYMVSLQLSAATWLINTKTLHRTSTISSISFRIITIVLITFRSLFCAKMAIFGVFDGATLSLGVRCHFNWARPLGWLIPKRCYRPQLFSTYVSGTSLMDKVLSDHFSWNKCRFPTFLTGVL